MITVIAVGYCPRQPELRVLSETAVKCEFEVLSKRNVKEGGNWVSVIESATFVAWNDQARRLAEHLTAGREITATGRQETSRWTDATGVKKSRVVFRLTDFEFGGPRPERRSDNSNGNTGSSEYRGEPPAERERPRANTPQPRYAQPLDRRPPAPMQQRQQPENDDTIMY